MYPVRKVMSQVTCAQSQGKQKYLETSFSLLFADCKQTAGGECKVHPAPGLLSLLPLAANFAVFAKATAASGRSQVDQGLPLVC